MRVRIVSISFNTIRRHYQQGLDSVFRLVTELEDRIEDLTTLSVPENRGG